MVTAARYRSIGLGLAILVVISGLAEKVSSQEIDKSALEKWRELPIIASFALNAEDPTGKVEESAKINDFSITFAAKSEPDLRPIQTHIRAPLLNIPGGLSSLQPLVQANQVRFDNLMATRFLPAVSIPIPGGIAISLETVRSVLDRDGSIYFELRVEFLRGRAFSVSADNELWRYKDGQFHLLKQPSQWSEGG